MIKAIELKNYRAFGVQTRIPLAPITLIYGQNSAGKSSILSALSLLKQTLDDNDPTATLLPRAERGLIKLGGFYELLHDHDATRTMSFRLDLEGREDGRLNARKVSGALEVGFGRESKRSDIEVKSLRVYNNGHDEPILEYAPASAPPEDKRAPLYVMRDRRLINLRAGLRWLKCTGVTSDPGFWKSRFDLARASRNDIRDRLRRMKAEDLSRAARLPAETAQASLDEAMLFYNAAFSMETYVERQRGGNLGQKLPILGFLPANTPFNAELAGRLPEVSAFLARMPPMGDASRGFTLDGVGLAASLSDQFREALRNLVPLGPYRRPPERLYVLSGSTPSDVGYSGGLVAQLLWRREALLAETNAWLKKLDVGYEIRIETLRSRSEEAVEIRLRDVRRKTRTTVALADVGFGVSQILPFVVQVIASQGKLLSIEQPEVHIHPKLQADLGDLLIEGIQPSRGHRFIIETHSEHLLLRLLRRIRESHAGNLTNGGNMISPKDLSVLYVSRDSRGALVNQLPVDDEGEFTRDWPDGFFAERARELF